VLYALLSEFDPNVESEKSVSKLAGIERKIDFAFPNHNIGIEAKIIRDQRRANSIIDEILADTANYRNDYLYCLFIVYDAAGAISNPLKVKQDLEKQGQIKVLIIKH
jgi:hypothetical protein